MFSNIFKNKTILISGHTGFKGSWLSLWLENLGAKVVGISLDIPTTPSNWYGPGTCPSGYWPDWASRHDRSSRR